MRAQGPVSPSSSVKLTQTSQASSLLSYQRGIRIKVPRPLGFVCSRYLRLHGHLLAPLPWGVGGHGWSSHKRPNPCHRLFAFQFCCFAVWSKAWVFSIRGRCRMRGRVWWSWSRKSSRLTIANSVERKSFILWVSRHKAVGEGSDWTSIWPERKWVPWLPSLDHLGTPLEGELLFFAAHHYAGRTII